MWRQQRRIRRQQRQQRPPRKQLQILQRIATGIEYSRFFAAFERYLKKPELLECRLDGKAVFVTGAVPGELVRVKQTGRNRTVAHADLAPSQTQEATPLGELEFF